MPICTKPVLFFTLLFSFFQPQKSTAQISLGVGLHSVYPRVLTDYFEGNFQGVNLRLGYQSTQRFKLVVSYSHFPNLENEDGADLKITFVNFEGQYNFLKNHENMKFYGVAAAFFYFEREEYAGNVENQNHPLFSLGLGIEFETEQKIGFFLEPRLIIAVPELVMGVYYKF